MYIWFATGGSPLFPRALPCEFDRFLLSLSADCSLLFYSTIMIPYIEMYSKRKYAKSTAWLLAPHIKDASVLSRLIEPLYRANPIQGLPYRTDRSGSWIHRMNPAANNYYYLSSSLLYILIIRYQKMFFILPSLLSCFDVVWWRRKWMIIIRATMHTPICISICQALSPSISACRRIGLLASQIDWLILL